MSRRLSTKRQETRYHHIFWMTMIICMTLALSSIAITDIIVSGGDVYCKQETK